MGSPTTMNRPYRKAMTIAPMFHIMFEPCMPLLGPVIAFLVRARWLITRALEIRVVPKFLPVIPIPYVREVFYLTLGDLLMLVPLLVLLFYGYNSTFVSPDVATSGEFASYAIYITVLTANKSNNLISLLFGIPFERLIPYHLLSSLVAIALGCFHTYVAYEYGTGLDDSEYSSFGPNPNFLKFLGDGQIQLTGSILTASMMATVLLSIVPLRRFMFQMWLVSHIVLMIAAMVTCFLHNITTIFFVMIWWVLDVSIRYFVMAGWRYREDATLELLDSGEDNRAIVRISIPKPEGFDYSPGQFVQIAVPAISLFELHPASITSAPHEDMVVLHFRDMGDWTHKLADLAMNEKTTTVMLEGPYGAVGLDLEDKQRYRTVLLVSGGIGNTHCESVGRALLHESSNRELQRLRYVWSVRKFAMVQEMPPLGGHQPTYAAGTSEEEGSIPETLPDSSPFTTAKGGTTIKPGTVEIDIYCTREDVEETLENASYRVHRKWPDYMDILAELKADAIKAGETNVAVIGCGPSSMMEELRNACRKQSSMVAGCSSEAVFFDLHTERFEF